MVASTCERTRIRDSSNHRINGHLAADAEIKELEEAADNEKEEQKLKVLKIR